MIPHSARVTIKHVAKEAGVSTQTVSRVINERPDVSPETRKIVMDVVDRLGYHPSELARSLIHRRSWTIGVVTAGLKYIGPNRTLNGITTEAEELGYAILLKELPDFSVEHADPILKFLLARQVDGILWAVPEVNRNHEWLAEGLENLNVPILFLTMSSRKNVSRIFVDNFAGGVLATEHLLKQGRKKVVHLSGPQDWWEARQRKAGWQDAMKRGGYKASSRQCVEGNWSSASGGPAFEQLLEANPDMDAIFAGNDQMALTVLQAAHKKGMRVPDDLAVVGFDNIIESAYFLPPLTTINYDQLELGCRGVQELVNKIETIRNDGKMESQEIMLTPELVVRESSVSQ